MYGGGSDGPGGDSGVPGGGLGDPGGGSGGPGPTALLLTGASPEPLLRSKELVLRRFTEVNPMNMLKKTPSWKLQPARSRTLEGLQTRG